MCYAYLNFQGGGQDWCAMPIGTSKGGQDSGKEEVEQLLSTIVSVCQLVVIMLLIIVGVSSHVGGSKNQTGVVL